MKSWISGNMWNVLFPLLQLHKLDYVCMHVIVVEFVVNDSVHYSLNVVNYAKTLQLLTKLVAAISFN